MDEIILDYCIMKISMTRNAPMVNPPAGDIMTKRGSDAGN